jgi:hypothetical protein
MATSDLFLAENRQKATVPNLSGGNSIFPLNQFARSSVFYKRNSDLVSLASIPRRIFQ